MAELAADALQHLNRYSEAAAKHIAEHSEFYSKTAAGAAAAMIAWMLLYATIMHQQEVVSMGRVPSMWVKTYAFSLCWMVGSFLGSLPAIPLLLIGQVRRSREVAHYFSGVLARNLHRMCFPPAVIEGFEHLPPDGTACVFVSNHQSTADIAVFYQVRRRFAWVSKASVFTIPGVGLIMRMSGYVSLTRGSKESGRKMMDDCRRKCLDKGWSVVIFPQGTRRRHKILDFKRGAFKIAQEAEVPIVPVTIELPEKLYAIGCKERPRLIIHKPIMPGTELFRDHDALLTHCFKTVIDGLSYGPAMLRKQQQAATAGAAAPPLPFSGGDGSTVASTDSVKKAN